MKSDEGEKRSHQGENPHLEKIALTFTINSVTDKALHFYDCFFEQWTPGLWQGA